MRYKDRPFVITFLAVSSFFLPFVWIFREKLVRVPLDPFDRQFDFVMKNRPVNLNHTVRKSEDDYIVPNIVHFIQVGSPTVNFIWYICIRSVIVNHKPNLILIHCDCDTLHGKYWERLKEESVPIEVRRLTVPKHVFGKPIAHIWHAGDVMRQRILLQMGGIYLDNDVFVLKSLGEYRRYEFSLGWPTGALIGSQVLISQKNATFLRLYYDSYREYDGSKWYYNAGELPTTKYLLKNPNLVHAEADKFGVSWPDPLYILYNQSRTVQDMQRQFCTIHLNARLRRSFVSDFVEEFNDDNIRTYKKTFGAMARSVLPEHAW